MYLFGFNGCLTPPVADYAVNIVGPTTAKTLELAGKGGAQGKTAALIGENYDAGKTGNLVVGASLASAGFKIVYNQNPMPAPPAQVSDYTPYVQAIMTANAG